MLSVLPFVHVQIEEALSRILEQHLAGRLRLRLIALGASILDRINSIGDELAILPRSLPCLFQGEGIDGTKTHVAGLAIHLEPKDPALRVVSGDLQIKATAKPGFLAALTFLADNWQDFTIQTSIHSLFVDSDGWVRIRLDTKSLRDAEIHSNLGTCRSGWDASWAVSPSAT